MLWSNRPNSLSDPAKRQDNLVDESIVRSIRLTNDNFVVRSLSPNTFKREVGQSVGKVSLCFWKGYMGFKNTFEINLTTFQV